MSIKIGFLDDHTVLINGLADKLRSMLGYEIAFTVSSKDELSSKLNTNNVDILISDVLLPQTNYVSMFKEVLKEHPKLNILAYSSINSLQSINFIYKLGVKGFISKEEPLDELITAIEQVSKGRKYYHKSLKDNSQAKFELEASKLTKREVDVLMLMIEGKQNKDIAKSLKLSINTIEMHRKNIYLKWNVNNIVACIKKATDLGLNKH